MVANEGYSNVINVAAKYFRVVFTNGSTIQSLFRLQSLATTGKSQDALPFTGLESFKQISTLNSSSTPLGISATFTGAGETTIYNTLLVSVTTDAAGTLYVDYSPDDVVWQSSSFSGYRIEADIPVTIKEAIKNTYFRVRLVNGTSAQTTLNLVSISGTFDEEYLTTFQQISRRNTGLQADYAPLFLIAFDDQLTTTYQDIWGTTGTMALPAGAESYEIVSTSASDAAAGTGARSIIIETLDASGLVQSQVVTPNGTTAVALAGTHTFPRSMIVISSGSNLGNVGVITMQVAGGGATRRQILANKSRDADGQYKVPSNVEFHITDLDYHTGVASKLVTIESVVMLPGTNTWVTTSELPFASQSFTRNFDETSSRFPPGSIIKYTGKVSTGSGDAVAVVLSGFERRIS